MIRWILIGLLLLAAHAGAAPVMVVDSQAEYWLPLDAQGWTALPENTDPSAVTIYVSSSEGDDANDGLSAESPVATLAQARALCRNGTSFTQQPGYTGSWSQYTSGAVTVAETISWYSDTILLKCGDTWAEELLITPGESEGNPFVVAGYGSGARPIVDSINKAGLSTYVCGSWAIVGVEFSGILYVNNSSYKTYGWDKASNILLEDCLVRGGVYLDQTDNIVINRCIVVDEYSTSSHAQGLLASTCNGVTITECLFDHNGWHDTVPDAEPTIFNHNIYIVYDSVGVVMRGSITARASATGAQLRSGGDCINNLFLDNPLALDWGFVNGASITVGGVTGEITNNVVLGDADICRPRPSCTELERGIGFQIANVASGTCTGNIITTRNTGSTGNKSISLDSYLTDNTPANIAEAGDIGISNFTVSGNITYGWDGGIGFGQGIFSNCLVQGNDVQDGSATNPLMRESVSVYGASTITVAGNRYYSGTLTDAYRIEDVDSSFAEWVAETGDTSTVTQVAYSDPMRSIATYMASLGYDEVDQTVEKFLELARANSKANWDVRFTADAVNDYIRAGFEE